MRLLIQIVHFDQSNSSGVVYTAQDRGVVARLQISNDRRLACHSRGAAAVLNIADLIAGDNSADYRGLPVIVGSDQRSGPVVQFQSRISQCVGDPILSKLGANGANEDSLWPTTLDNKTTNHHMLARLNKAAGADVTQTCVTGLS